jgi:hypothetical protein
MVAAIAALQAALLGWPAVRLDGNSSVHEQLAVTTSRSCRFHDFIACSSLSGDGRKASAASWVEVRSKVGNADSKVHDLAFLLLEAAFGASPGLQPRQAPAMQFAIVECSNKWQATTKQGSQCYVVNSFRDVSTVLLSVDQIKASCILVLPSKEPISRLRALPVSEKGLRCMSGTSGRPGRCGCFECRCRCTCWVLLNA